MTASLRASVCSPGASPLVSASSSRNACSDGSGERRTWFSAKFRTSRTPAQRASRVIGSGYERFTSSR